MFSWLRRCHTPQKREVWCSCKCVSMACGDFPFKSWGILTSRSAGNQSVQRYTSEPMIQGMHDPQNQHTFSLQHTFPQDGKCCDLPFSATNLAVCQADCWLCASGRSRLAHQVAHRPAESRPAVLPPFPRPCATQVATLWEMCVMGSRVTMCLCFSDIM